MMTLKSVARSRHGISQPNQPTHGSDPYRLVMRIILHSGLFGQCAEKTDQPTNKDSCITEVPTQPLLLLDCHESRNIAAVLQEFFEEMWNAIGMLHPCHDIDFMGHDWTSIAVNFERCQYTNGVNNNANDEEDFWSSDELISLDSDSLTSIFRPMTHDQTQECDKNLSFVANLYQFGRDEWPQDMVPTRPYTVSTLLRPSTGSLQLDAAQFVKRIQRNPVHERTIGTREYEPNSWHSLPTAMYNERGSDRARSALSDHLSTSGFSNTSAMHEAKCALSSTTSRMNRICNDQGHPSLSARSPITARQLASAHQRWNSLQQLATHSEDNARHFHVFENMRIMQWNKTYPIEYCPTSKTVDSALSDSLSSPYFWPGSSQSASLKHLTEHDRELESMSTADFYHFAGVKIRRVDTAELKTSRPFDAEVTSIGNISGEFFKLSGSPERGVDSVTKTRRVSVPAQKGKRPKPDQKELTLPPISPIKSLTVDKSPAADKKLQSVAPKDWLTSIVTVKKPPAQTRSGRPKSVRLKKRKKAFSLPAPRARSDIPERLPVARFRPEKEKHHAFKRPHKDKPYVQRRLEAKLEPTREKGELKPPQKNRGYDMPSSKGLYSSRGHRKQDRVKSPHEGLKTKPGTTGTKAEEFMEKKTLAPVPKKQRVVITSPQALTSETKTSPQRSSKPTIQQTPVTKQLTVRPLKNLGKPSRSHPILSVTRVDRPEPTDELDQSVEPVTAKVQQSSAEGKAREPKTKSTDFKPETVLQKVNEPLSASGLDAPVITTKPLMKAKEPTVKATPKAVSPVKRPELKSTPKVITESEPGKPTFKAATPEPSGRSAASKPPLKESFVKKQEVPEKSAKPETSARPAVTEPTLKETGGKKQEERTVKVTEPSPILGPNITAEETRSPLKTKSVKKPELTGKPAKPEPVVFPETSATTVTKSPLKERDSKKPEELTTKAAKPEPVIVPQTSTTTVIKSPLKASLSEKPDVMSAKQELVKSPDALKAPKSPLKTDAPEKTTERISEGPLRDKLNQKEEIDRSKPKEPTAEKQEIGKSDAPRLAQPEPAKQTLAETKEKPTAPKKNVESKSTQEGKPTDGQKEFEKESVQPEVRPKPVDDKADKPQRQLGSKPEKLGTPSTAEPSTVADQQEPQPVKTSQKQVRPWSKKEPNKMVPVIQVVQDTDKNQELNVATQQEAPSPHLATTTPHQVQPGFEDNADAKRRPTWLSKMVEAVIPTQTAQAVTQPSEKPSPSVTQDKIEVKTMPVIEPGKQLFARLSSGPLSERIVPDTAAIQSTNLHGRTTDKISENDRSASFIRFPSNIQEAAKLRGTDDIDSLILRKSQTRSQLLVTTAPSSTNSEVEFVDKFYCDSHFFIPPY